MKSKWLIVILIFLMFISVGAVSAADNSTDDAVNVADNACDDVMSTADEETLGDTPGSFNDLNSSIYNSYNRGERHISLTKDYEFKTSAQEFPFFNGIVLKFDDPVTIDGKGFSISGDNRAEIFDLASSNIILTNITFLNAKNCAVEVYNEASNCVINNSLFQNNRVVEADRYGGAIQWQGPNGKVLNSNFTDNCAEESYAGAIWWVSDNGIVSNCIFTNNSALYESTEGFAGAIYWEGNNGKLTGSRFERNRASTYGGAVNWKGNGGTVLNCNFSENTVRHGLIDIQGDYYDALGGAIYSSGNDFNITSCIFDSNYAQQGGAVYSNAVVYIEYSTFRLNRADDVDQMHFSAGGGSIYLAGGDSSFIKHSLFESNHAHWAGAVWNGVSDTLIYNCTFNENWAASHGVIYSIGEGLLVNNSTFEANYAFPGESGVIGIEANKNVIANSSFTNNHANLEGGAIYSLNQDTGIYNCTFKSNVARTGGAIYSAGENLIVFNVTLESNIGIFAGGALEIEGINAKIFNCTFKLNTVPSSDGYGGAISSVDTASGLNVTKCIFESNSVFVPFDTTEPVPYVANWGGAVSADGDGLIIHDCTFKSNNASGDKRLGVTSYSSGGAISTGGQDIVISKCVFTDNTCDHEGGAIYFWNHGNTLSTNLVNCNFESNNATDNGGAICISGVKMYFENLTFNGNNASKGSAIYLGKNSELDIANTEFGRNRADSSAIEIIVYGNASYAKSYVTVEVYLIANDNIANAIWNNNENGDNIRLKKIKCEFSEYGGDRAYVTFNNEWDYPTIGYRNSDKIWQSSNDRAVEDAQLIDVLIVNNKTGEVVYNLTEGIIETTLKRGVLSASSYYSALIVTDTDGSITKDFPFNLKAGIYDIVAKHKGDEYYAPVESSASFVIYDANITKTTEDTLVGIGDNVTYNVTVFNNGDLNLTDIYVVDVPPENFTLLDYSTTWINVSGDISNKTLYGDFVIMSVMPTGGIFFVINNTRMDDGGMEKMSSLGPHEGIVLTLVFSADKIGEYNNTVGLTSDLLMDSIVVTSNNTTVVGGNLTVNKMVLPGDPDWCDIWGTITFRINVTNTGGVDVDGFTVVEHVPDGFNPEFYDEPDVSQVFDDPWSRNSTDSSMLIYNGVLKPGESATRLIRLFGVKAGNYTNKVTVRSDGIDPVVGESENVTVYDPRINVTKTVVDSNVIIGDQAVFIINVTNTGDRTLNAHEISVDDMFGFDELVYDHSVNVTGNWVFDDSMGVPSWRLNSTLKVNDSASFKIYFNTTKVGQFTNFAYASLIFSSDWDTDNVTVLPKVTKSVNTTSINVNQSVEYSIFINCTGLDDLSKLVIRDVLNESFVLDESSITGDWKYENGAFRYIGSAGPCNNITLKFAVKITKPGNYANTAAVAIGNLPEVTAKSNATSVKGPDMTVTKKVDKSEIDAGQTVKYTIVVSNIGVCDLSDVKVQDKFTNRFVLVDYDKANWSYNNDGVFTYKDSIAVGKNATLTIEVKITEPGVYNNTVSVTSKESETKSATSGNTAVRNPAVKKLPSTVTPKVKDIHVGDNEVINIRVGPDDATGTVDVTVAGKTYRNVPLVRGSAKISVPGLKAGNYAVKVSYSGDDKYLPSENTASFKVEKILPPLKVSNPTITVGKDGIVTISVPDDATGTVTIKVGGKTYTAPVKNGKAIFKIPGLKAGTHAIRAFYSGDAKYLPNDAAGTIKVLPKEDKKQTAHKKVRKHAKTGLERYETGNPIFALIVVLSLLGVSIKRRK